MVTKMTSNIKVKKPDQSPKRLQEEHQKIAIVVGQSIVQQLKKQEQYQQQQTSHKVRLTQAGKSLTGSVKSKQLNLGEITKELSEEMRNKMNINAVARILKEDKKSFLSSAQLDTRVKILSLLWSENNESLTSNNISELVKKYVFEDLRNRSDIAFHTISNEYLKYFKTGELTNYTQCLNLVLSSLIEKSELKDRDYFLPRFYIESPLLTDESIDLLRHFIISEEFYIGSVTVGLNILKILIEKKKTKRAKLLPVLLELCVSPDKSEIRSQAVKAAKNLHEIYGSDIRDPIEAFALQMLRHLLEANPPEIIKHGSWTEESIKICLILYLSLLPTNHKLIHDLAVVYVGTSADTKRIILRVLEGPVKGMGMNSPELLLLVENCPKGAETLVTRIIHVLTDKQPPSSELVARVRDLYQVSSRRSVVASSSNNGVLFTFNYRNVFPTFVF